MTGMGIFVIFIILMILFQCNAALLYPFVLFFGTYVVFMALQHVQLMLYLKNFDVGLGIFILACYTGGLVICKYKNSNSFYAQFLCNVRKKGTQFTFYLL